MSFYQHLLKRQGAYIIAEAGVNHNGRLDRALRMVDAARACGCDAVKFQTFRTEDVISPQAQMAPYQCHNTGRRQSQFAMVKKLELAFEDFRVIARHCRKAGIEFLSTPCDAASLELLCSLQVPCLKIGSAEVTNIPFLQAAARTGKPIILSTGMADLAEVRAAVAAMRRAGNAQIVLLHCVTDYPAAKSDVNLRAMLTLKKTFRCPVGYSDHTLGDEVSLAAVALGAQVIEKHFTLDKTLAGPDHKASMDPGELGRMVARIRAVEAALGDGIKRPARSEEKNKEVVRRSLVALRDWQPGERITSEMIGAKRPSGGLEPRRLAEVIGRTVRRPVKADAQLSWKDVT